MNPTLDIIHHLIEQYFDNNGGREDYDRKEVIITKFGDRVQFYWVAGINSKGREELNDEYFDYTPKEGVTMLESYVNEVIDRILKHPFFDERVRTSDPSTDTIV